MSKLILNAPRLRIKVEVSGKIVKCELVKSNKRSVIVRLENGDIVKRKMCKVGI